MKIYRIAVTDGEFRDVKDSIRGVKDDVRDIKKDIRDFDSRLKKMEKEMDSLNIGNRRYTQDRTVFTSLQRKLERMETVELEWKKYKEGLSDDIKREVEKHTKARISALSPTTAK